MNTEIDKEIEGQIWENVRQGNPLGVRLYAILDKTEVMLERLVSIILEHYDRLDLQSAVYTAVKELAVNGTKANFKRILFREENIDIEKEYENGMDLFRERLNETFIRDYARKGQELGLGVEVLLSHSPDVLQVEVYNNVAITETEDKRIRSKFQKSMGYEDIAQFYMDAGDSSEGAGMGITLVTMMLKASGIDPHNFTIRSNHDSWTVAKIVIPLREDFQTDRDRYAAEKAEARTEAVLAAK